MQYLSYVFIVVVGSYLFSFFLLGFIAFKTQAALSFWQQHPGSLFFTCSETQSLSSVQVGNDLYNLS